MLLETFGSTLALISIILPYFAVLFVLAVIPARAAWAIHNKLVVGRSPQRSVASFAIVLIWMAAASWALFEFVRFVYPIYKRLANAGPNPGGPGPIQEFIELVGAAGLIVLVGLPAWALVFGPSLIVFLLLIHASWKTSGRRERFTQLSEPTRRKLRFCSLIVVTIGAGVLISLLIRWMGNHL